MRSETPDSFGPRSYETIVSGKAAAGIVAIEIEDVSVYGGRNRFYGPYDVGQLYGVEPAGDAGGSGRRFAKRQGSR
ncbi:MAG: hypothetical protein R2862_00875 [Thermoanaerobaculia bacterium]